MLVPPAATACQLWADVPRDSGDLAATLDSLRAERHPDAQAPSLRHDLVPAIRQVGTPTDGVALCDIVLAEGAGKPDDEWPALRVQFLIALAALGVVGTVGVLQLFTSMNPVGRTANFIKDLRRHESGESSDASVHT